MTNPEEPTVATPVAELLHEPPGEASLNDVTELIQTPAAPAMAPAAGAGLTVTTCVANTTPQVLVIL